MTGRPPPRDLGVPVSLAAAAVAFALLFRGVVFHFWAQMAISVGALCLLGWLFDREGTRALLVRPEAGWPRTVAAGALSAAPLYFVFYGGNEVAARVLASGGQGVADIYRLKAGAPIWLISLLMALVIGPGEEIFWRGYLQRNLVDRYGRAGLALGILAYAGVHLASGNLMLIMAALVCGAFWGLLFHRYRSIWLNVVSHTLWDLAVFVFWPLSTPG